MSTDVQTQVDGAGRKNRKLRNLLLNKRFQLKYTAMMVGISLLVSIVLGLFLIDKVRENSRMLRLEEGFDAAFQQELSAADAQIVFSMVAAFVVFNVVLFLLGLLITHRLAGPIYVFRRYITDIGNGLLPQTRALRKGDEFHELLDAIEAAVVRMETRANDEIATLERVKQAIGDDGDLLARVDALIEQKRQMVQPRTADLNPEDG